MDIAQLGISVDSRQVKTARDELGRFVSTGNQAEKATSGVTSATQAFGSALASLGIAAATSQLIKMADTYGLLQSKIGLATGEMTKAAEATDMVFAAAQRARVGVDELGNMVAKLAPSIRDMGGTTADAVAASELFGKTLKISGASAAEASSAILQFGQALGTGRLGGEEFNAVNESSGRYMQLLAKELGVTRGELKKMAEDGKLTGDVLINALANNATTLESEFAQLRVTGADAMEQLKNSTMQAAFEIDNATGVSQTFGGVLNAGRGVIDAVTLALRDTNTEASNSGVIIPTATAVFQALGVAAAETVYVFRETGRTLGALAAQAAALAQGDLDLFRRIGEERDRDSVAARASVDKLTASILASETASAKLATTAPKLSTGLKAVATSGKDADKAAKAAARAAAQAADAYGDLERSLSKQLMTEQELTTEQRVSMDLTDKRYKNLSDKQKAHLIALAKEVDAFKAQQKLLGEIATAAQALSESITKSQQAEVDAAYAAAKATEDQLAKLLEEAETYGMTESQIQQYLLAKAEEKLALEKGGEARQGVIDQIEREIEARRKLVSVAQGGEARKAADDMGGAVQKSLADAVKAGLEASNPIKGFAQSLGNSVKNALYNAVAQGLATRIASVVGFGGASGAATASGGGGADAGSLLGLLGAATGGNSIGTALANGALGGEFGIFANAGSVSNLALAGYGLAGGLFGNLIGAGKSGSTGGSLGASAGALIGGPLGALAGGLAGSVLGGVLGGAWKGGGGQKFGGEGAIGRATASLFPEGQTDAQVQSALDTFGTGVQDIVKKLGGSLSGLQYAYGYETDPQGTAGNFFSSQLSVGGQMLRNINVQQYTGEASDQMAKEFKTATVLALQKANLSADLQTAFDGFDPAIEGAADKVLARLEQIKAVGDAFDQLGKIMPNLAGLSLEAKESLLALAGGSEQLVSGLSAYYDAFYTEAERAGMATAQLASQFADLGIAVPDSAAAFRQLVESQDLSTEAGRKLYAQLLGLSGAFSSVAESAKAAATSMLQTALGAVKDAIDAEKDKATAASAAVIAGYQSQIDAAKAAAAATIASTKQQIAAINDSIRAKESEGRQQIASIQEQARASKQNYASQIAQAKANATALKQAAKEQERAQDLVIKAMQTRVSDLQSVYDMLAGAIAGDEKLSFEEGSRIIADAIAAGGVTDKDQLKLAIDAVKSIDESGYSTRVALERAKASATADMTRLQGIVGSQLDQQNSLLSIAEKQLEVIQNIPDTIEAALDADVARYEALADQAAASYEAQIDAVQAAMEQAALAGENQVAALEKLIEQTTSNLESSVGNFDVLIAAEKSNLDTQLTALDKLYEEQKSMVEAALGTTKAVMSVEQAISALGAALKAAQTPVATQLEAGYKTQIGQIYRDVLNREADVQGLAFYVQQAVAGKSLAQIRAEIAASPEAMGLINGSHKNGLAEVPFDGYRAELHAGERVLTAQQADSSDKMAFDLAEMKAEMKAALYAIADNTRRTARLQERWDGDGLPDARGY